MVDSSSFIQRTHGKINKGHRDKQYNRLEKKSIGELYIHHIRRHLIFLNMLIFFEELYKKEWYYLVELNEYMLKFFFRSIGHKY